MLEGIFLRLLIIQPREETSSDSVTQFGVEVNPRRTADITDDRVADVVGRYTRRVPARSIDLSAVPAMRARFYSLGTCAARNPRIRKFPTR